MQNDNIELGKHTTHDPRHDSIMKWRGSFLNTRKLCWPKMDWKDRNVYSMLSVFVNALHTEVTFDRHCALMERGDLNGQELMSLNMPSAQARG